MNNNIKTFLFYHGNYLVVQTTKQFPHNIISQNNDVTGQT